MTEEKKKRIEGFLADHVKWLQDSSAGKRLVVWDDDLKGYDLSGRDLRGAYFSDSDLEGTNLERADVRLADFENANLEKANLEEADLEQANLRRANLRRANLERANLKGAIIEHADFQAANLYGASLDVNALKGDAIKGAIFLATNLKETILEFFNAECPRCDERVVDRGTADELVSQSELDSMSHRVELMEREAQTALDDLIEENCRCMSILATNLKEAVQEIMNARELRNKMDKLIDMVEDRVDPKKGNSNLEKNNGK